MNNKALTLLLVALFGLMSALTSCSNEPHRVKPTSIDTPEVLRVVDLETGIPIPIKVSREDNIYKIGDSVWVDYQTHQIINQAPMTLSKDDLRGAVGDRLVQKMRIEEAPY